MYLLFTPEPSNRTDGRRHEADNVLITHHVGVRACACMCVVFVCATVFSVIFV